MIRDRCYLVFVKLSKNYPLIIKVWSPSTKFCLLARVLGALHPLVLKTLTKPALGCLI